MGIPGGAVWPDFKQSFESELIQALQKVSLTGEKRENHIQLMI